MKIDGSIFLKAGGETVKRLATARNSCFEHNGLKKTIAYDIKLEFKKELGGGQEPNIYM